MNTSLSLWTEKISHIRNWLNNVLKIKRIAVKAASIQAKSCIWILMEQGHVVVCMMAELCRARWWMTQCKTVISSPASAKLELMSIQLSLYWSSPCTQGSVIAPPESSTGVKTTLAPNGRSGLNLCWWQGWIWVHVHFLNNGFSYLTHKSAGIVSMHGAGDPPWGTMVSTDIFSRYPDIHWTGSVRTTFRDFTLSFTMH